ncbi:MAG TPA: glycosyltransferase family 4 protein [archaeon]|nr:glycosyltransferase family 4 protein [archaeon]
MRVLFLIPFYAPHRVGGAELSTELSARALAAAGHRVTVLTPNFASSQWKKEAQGKVTVLRFPFPLRFGPKLFAVFNSNLFHLLLARHARRAIRDTRAQLLHIQTAAFAPGGVRAAEAERIPAVVTLRDFGFAHNVSIDREDAVGFQFSEAAYAASLAKRFRGPMAAALPLLYPSLRLNLAFRRRALKKASALVCVSEFLAAEAARSLGSTRCVPIYHPAPPLKPAAARPIPGTLLFVGRLGELKGASLLLRALADASRQRPDLQLWLIGNSAIPRYRGLAERLGIASRCHFLGSVPNHRLPHYYARAAAVVVPSVRAEPLSRVLIEASLLGKPVVATRAGGNPELIEQRKTGLLADPNPAALSAAILELLSDRKLQARCAAALKKRAALFRPAAHARQLTKLYERVLKDARR